MIGNDVDEDLCSAKLGFDTYLITDTIVNRDNKDYSDYKNGSFVGILQRFSSKAIEYDYIVRSDGILLCLTAFSVCI